MTAKIAIPPKPSYPRLLKKKGYNVFLGIFGKSFGTEGLKSVDPWGTIWYEIDNNAWKSWVSVDNNLECVHKILWEITLTADTLYWGLLVVPSRVR